MKTLAQQDIQSLQRMQSRLGKSRTATSNQLRGFLAEYWTVLPTGLAHLRQQIPGILEDAEQPLTPVARQFLDQLYCEILTLYRYRSNQTVIDKSDCLIQALKDCR